MKIKLTINRILVGIAVCLTVPHFLIHHYGNYQFKYQQIKLQPTLMLFDVVIIVIAVACVAAPFAHFSASRVESKLKSVLNRNSTLSTLVVLSMIVGALNILGLNEKGSDQKIGYVTLLFPMQLPVLLSTLLVIQKKASKNIFLLVMNLMLSLFVGSKSIIALILLQGLLLMTVFSPSIPLRKMISIIGLLAAAISFFIAMAAYRLGMASMTLLFENSDKFISILLRRISWFDGVMLNTNVHTYTNISLMNVVAILDRFLPGSLVNVTPIGTEAINLYNGTEKLLAANFSGSFGLPGLLKILYHENILTFVVFVGLFYAVSYILCRMIQNGSPIVCLIGLLCLPKYVMSVFISGNIDRALSDLIIFACTSYFYLFIFRNVMRRDQTLTDRAFT